MLASEFSDLYHRSYPYLCQLIGSGNPGCSVEDTIQEVYLAAWARFQHISHPNPFGWLIITARHKLSDQLRRQRKESAFCVPLDQVLEASNRIIFHHMRIEHLWETDPPYGRVLQLLNQDELSLLLAYYEDGVPISELSSRLGITPHACQMRLHRAKKKLTPLLRTA